MTADNHTQLAPHVHALEVIGLADFEGEPRARDVDVGEKLGFERPRAIRQIISRNLAEIEALGPAPRRVALLTRPQGGSVEVEEFWLNEEQALLVAVLSKAPRAAEVRSMLIRVFVAWRRGHIENRQIAVAEILSEARKQIGGIVKSVVHSEIAAISAEMIAAAVRSELAAQSYAIRRGKTAGQIWRENGFRPLHGIAGWFGNRLAALGCRIEGNGCGELGLSKARLFDPDKVATWLDNGGRHVIEKKIVERAGQTVVQLVGKAPGQEHRDDRP